MKQLLATCLLYMFATVALADEPTQPAAQSFDRYWVVFLVRPESPEDHGTERNAQLQREHLDHLTWLWKQGYALVAGPFGTEPEDRMRGVVLLRGDLGEAQARELAEKDPRVRAGQLQVELRAWFTGEGVMAFPKTPVADTTS